MLFDLENKTDEFPIKVIYILQNKRETIFSLWNTSKRVENVSRIFLVFVISQLIQHQNLKILVTTTNNYQGIIWGRDNNFHAV